MSNWLSRATNATSLSHTALAADKSVTPARDLPPQSIISEAGSRSSTGSRVSDKLKEAQVRQAVAELKLRQVQAEQDLKRKALDLEMQTQILKIQSKAEMARAECEIWSEH